MFTCYCRHCVQGGILSGEGGDEVKDILLLDVCPLSLVSKARVEMPTGSLFAHCVRQYKSSRRGVGRSPG